MFGEMELVLAGFLRRFLVGKTKFFSKTVVAYKTFLGGGARLCLIIRRRCSVEFLELCGVMRDKMSCHIVSVSHQ
jgi:hypothetical protein